MKNISPNMFDNLLNITVILPRNQTYCEDFLILAVRVQLDAVVPVPCVSAHSEGLAGIPDAWTNWDSMT